MATLLLAGVLIGLGFGSRPELMRTMPERFRWAASLALAAFLVSPACMRGTEALPPGEYITEGGSGVLTISPSGDRTKFSIKVISPTGHTCGLEGEIRNLQAHLEMEGEDEVCQVRFQPKADGVEVSHDGITCHRYFCGARADFEGEYLRPNPGCDSRERRATREEFQKLYDAKSYAKAAALLGPLLSRCSRTLDYVEDGWIRNDLAITQYHLGRLTDCRKTLEPLLEEASKTEEELRKSYPPADFESFFPVAKATSHNARLCGPVAAVTFETRTIERKEGHDTVSFSYPVIRAAPSEALRAALTQEIDKLLVGDGGQAATPEAAADEFLAECRSARKGSPEAAGIPWNLSRTAEMIYQDAKVVSLRLYEWAYTGGAHGGSSVRYASFDPATGRRLGLADLIKPDGMARLVEIGERELRKVREIRPEQSLEEAGFTFAGGKFALGQQMAVLAEGLAIYYNLYEIAPYVAGPTEILIPRSKLAPIAKPEGPLGSATDKKAQDR